MSEASHSILNKSQEILNMNQEVLNMNQEWIRWEKNQMVNWKFNSYMLHGFVSSHIWVRISRHSFNCLTVLE